MVKGPARRPPPATQRDLGLRRDRMTADDRKQMSPGARHDVEYGISPAPHPPSLAELVGQFGHREVRRPLTIQAQVQIG